jgi:hypothetical protein
MGRLRWKRELSISHTSHSYVTPHTYQVLRMMLAADARAEGAMPGGPGRAAMGRDEIVKSLEPYLAQIKGHIQEVGGLVVGCCGVYVCVCICPDRAPRHPAYDRPSSIYIYIPHSPTQMLPVKLMRNGTETRTVLITGKGPIRQRVGVAIVWMGASSVLA